MQRQHYPHEVGIVMHSPVMVSSHLRVLSRKHVFHCGSAAGACSLLRGGGYLKYSGGQRFLTIEATESLDTQTLGHLISEGYEQDVLALEQISCHLSSATSGFPLERVATCC